MHDSHVGDAAELYALGLLEPDERERVDAHIASCATCLRAVGAAEETVLELERGPMSRAAQHRAISPLWLAVAAAFIIGLLPSIPMLIQMQHAQSIAAARSAATLAMIQSHFTHVQFMPVTPGAPNAKVIYARNGTWIYVIVSGAHRYQVRTNGGSILGTTEPSGATSELWVRSPPRATVLELRDSRLILERARLK